MAPSVDVRSRPGAKNGGFKSELIVNKEGSKIAPAAVLTSTGLWNVDQGRLSKDGDASFVLPSKRGIDPFAPDFDPEAFVDLLGEHMMSIQHAVLREILEHQAGVEYLRRHGLNGRTDVESFRKCVPVVSYNDIEADITKLVNADATARIFSVDPISYFHYSLGTTNGKPKYIPSTVRSFVEFDGTFPPFNDALYRRLILSSDEGKALVLAFAGKQETTPSGIKVAAVTTNRFRSARFLNRVKGPSDEYCVPNEVILCDDSKQGMYCHLLCALAQAPDIVRVSSGFAAVVVAGARALQKLWPELVEDIRAGTLNEMITDRELRAAVAKTLSANPDLARQIERECSQENWEGIFPRLFPNAKFVRCVLSGSMLQYAPALKHFAGHLPILSPGYAASECGIIGLNINLMCAPEDITYMLLPEKCYYEFIPVEAAGHCDDHAKHQGSADVKVLEAHEVEVGKEYEILITNIAGFYRYRLGDVLRVVRFHKAAPVVAFARRKNVVLSVFHDKTDEEELQAVVMKAAALLRESSSMELSDYSSTADVSSSFPGRYVIFWEMVDSRNLDHDVLQKCANTLDAGFNFAYRVMRCTDYIGPLELRIVREGTFEQKMNAAVMRGAAPSQYKTPRCVNNPHALQVLKESTVASFHSTATPSAVL